MSALYIKFLLSIPLAFLLGFAAQKGSICAVRVVEDLLRGRFRQLVAVLCCSLWVLGVTVPLAWVVPGSTLAIAMPVTLSMVVGGIAFGIGAVVNGGCAISTLTRCAAGDVSRAFTVLGMALGLILLGVAGGSLDPDSSTGRLSPLASPSPPAWVLIAGAVLTAGAVLLRTRRDCGWRNLLRQRSWDPVVATTLIGLSGGTLYALHGPWMYTSLLPHALNQSVSPDGVPVWEMLVLLAAVMAGAAWAAFLSGRSRLRISVGQAGRCMFGGGLMGVGGALSIGGNDVMVLHTIPALAPSGIAGLAAIFLGSLAAILANRAYRRLLAR